MLSQTEENYIKALFHLTNETDEKTKVGTNELASYLEVNPATVNDMLKRLKDKELVDYKKYGKISLTETGESYAVEIIRKHRLWKTFLFEKLNFGWDEIHELAEQLEHIKSAKLISRLEEFLDYPDVDPHGDPIPNQKGEIKIIRKKVLSEIKPGNLCKLIAVKDSSVSLLQYASKLGLGLGSEIKIIGLNEFDDSLEIEIDKKHHTVSK